MTQDPARSTRRGLLDLIGKQLNDRPHIARMVYVGPGSGGRVRVRDVCSEEEMEAVALGQHEAGELVLVASPAGDSRTAMVLGGAVATVGSAAPILSSPAVRPRPRIGREAPLVCPTAMARNIAAVLSKTDWLKIQRWDAGVYGSPIWERNIEGWSQVVDTRACDLVGDRLALQAPLAGNLTYAVVDAIDVRTWDTGLAADGEGWVMAYPRWAAGYVWLAAVAPSGGGWLHRWRPTGDAAGLVPYRYAPLPPDTPAGGGIQLAVRPDGRAVLGLASGTDIRQLEAGAWSAVMTLPDSIGGEWRYAGNDTLSLGSGMLLDLRTLRRWLIAEWFVSDWGSVTAGNGRLISYRHDLSGEGGDRLLGVAIPPPGGSYSSVCTPPTINLTNPGDGYRAAGAFGR